MLKLWNKKKTLTVGAPLAGEAVPVAQVNDPTFSEDILGRGMAIRPTGGRVVAPVDGVVTQMFETGHAVSLTSRDGVELLVHVGLDTIRLKGEHYTIRAHTGDEVKAGDVLMECDLTAIQAAGYDIITPIVVIDANQYASVEMETGRTVTELDEIIRIEK